MADSAVARIAQFNRRTLDAIAARIYFYYSLAYEETGELASIRRSHRPLPARTRPGLSPPELPASRLPAPLQLLRAARCWRCTAPPCSGTTRWGRRRS